jgi:hypothetical protein
MSAIVVLSAAKNLLSDEVLRFAQDDIGMLSSNNKRDERVLRSNLQISFDTIL